MDIHRLHFVETIRRGEGTPKRKFSMITKKSIVCTITSLYTRVYRRNISMRDKLKVQVCLLYMIMRVLSYGPFPPKLFQ